MADYYTQTVVHQTIPTADITPLERLLLSHIFETEPDTEGLYLFSEQGPSDMLWLARDDVEMALAASEAMESAANGFTREQLSKLQADATEVHLDMSEPGWPFLFQDIVRRSSTLQYVSIEASFTCSKMRSDGFGGMAMLITADDIFSKTTGELLQTFEDEAAAKLDVAPDPGDSRVLCELRYPAIRNLIAGLAARDPAFTTVPLRRRDDGRYRPGNSGSDRYELLHGDADRTRRPHRRPRYPRRRETPR